MERTIATAQSFAAGMLRAGGVNVNYYSAPDSDPLFDPVGAGVAQLDQRKTIAAVMGQMRASLMKLKRTWWKTGAAFNWVLVPKKMVAPKTL